MSSFAGAVRGVSFADTDYLILTSDVKFLRTLFLLVRACALARQARVRFLCVDGAFQLFQQQGAIWTSMLAACHGRCLLALPCVVYVAFCAFDQESPVE